MRNARHLIILAKEYTSNITGNVTNADKTFIEKLNKIYYNTEKMLDSALSNAKAHYDKAKDIESFLKIQEQINDCKKENDVKVRFLNTELKIK